MQDIHQQEQIIPLLYWHWLHSVNIGPNVLKTNQDQKLDTIALAIMKTSVYMYIENILYSIDGNGLNFGYQFGTARLGPSVFKDLVGGGSFRGSTYFRTICMQYFDNNAVSIYIALTSHSWIFAILGCCISLLEWVVSQWFSTWFSYLQYPTISLAKPSAPSWEHPIEVRRSM